LQLNAKKRYNLQRQERLLRDKFGGALALERVGGVADIPLLVRGLATMWERRKSPMEDGGPNAAYYTRIAADLAKRGVWRSYSLVGGSEILALMFGCQFGNVYEVYGTWFNRRYAQYSPGTTLWHMFLRDLIANDPPRLICLGRGEPSPKHFQWMDFAESTTVVMHRRTVGNQALRAARGAYRLLTSRSHPMIHPTMRP
jgi:hypothetical protein